VPAAPAPGALALGLRQPENLAGAACDDGQDAVAIFSGGLLVPSRPEGAMGDTDQFERGR
jgi:hypothetical protein